MPHGCVTMQHCESSLGVELWSSEFFPDLTQSVLYIFWGLHVIGHTHRSAGCHPIHIFRHRSGPVLRICFQLISPSQNSGHCTLVICRQTDRVVDCVSFVSVRNHFLSYKLLNITHMFKQCLALSTPCRKLFNLETKPSIYSCTYGYSRSSRRSYSSSRSC